MTAAKQARVVAPSKPVEQEEQPTSNVAHSESMEAASSTEASSVPLTNSETSEIAVEHVKQELKEETPAPYSFDIPIPSLEDDQHTQHYQPSHNDEPSHLQTPSLTTHGLLTGQDFSFGQDFSSVFGTPIATPTFC